MKDVEVSEELKNNIEKNQNLLKNAIRNHQNFLAQLKAEPDNPDMQKHFNKTEQEIVLIGITQKTLFERLREEYKFQQLNFKTNVLKNSIEERRFNLSTALSRARKQNIICRVAPRPATFSVSSVSDDSIEAASIHSTPEKQVYQPVDPQEVTQPEFLTHFGLVTHDVYKEMQNKRVERKRRSTANPHFLYGNKGWDFQPPLPKKPPTGKGLYHTKRKKNSYLFSSVSPPNTRQSVKKRNERTSPPPNNNNNNVANGNNAQKNFTPLPPLPNLPSGLTIERVSPSSSSSPDSKSCVSCRQTGVLIICEKCTNGFHVRCHNRPLAQSPRQCPKCIRKEIRTVGSLNVPSGMSVSYITATEVSEKIEEKQVLEKINQSLSAELTQLQDRHSQLTISLRSQQSQKEDLLMSQQTTEDKIKQILTFITDIKKSQITTTTTPVVEDSSSPQPQTPPTGDETPPPEV